MGGEYPGQGLVKLSETATIKTRAPRKSRFDMAERERLRATLLHYAKQHGIGVPTLQVRLAEGTDRSPDLLPLKTLQRFLAGIGRTNDAFLIPCFEFAQSLPAAPGLESFAREAAGYFGVNLDAAGDGGPAGKYAVFTGPQETRTGMRAFTPAELAREQFSILHSRCVLEKRGSGPCTIREEVILAAGETGSEDVRHIYEGVVLCFEPLIFMVAKNLLTRLPRAYWLRQFDDGTLAGYGMEAAFLTSMSEARPYSKTVDFEFRPDAQEDQS